MDEPLPDPGRLARALRLAVDFRAELHRELSDFLRAHEDLRDLLEPMLAELAEVLPLESEGARSPERSPAAERT
jgi:hypothetical protein